MKRKQYLYAISFWSTDSQQRTGQGCVQIIRPQKIKTLEDFNGVSNYIKETNNLTQLAICNIMLLGKVRADCSKDKQ